MLGEMPHRHTVVEVADCLDDSSTADFEAYAISKDSKLLDKHEKIIDNMHDEYLIDVPTIKENKHISKIE